MHEIVMNLNKTSGQYRDGPHEEPRRLISSWLFPFMGAKLEIIYSLIALLLLSPSPIKVEPEVDFVKYSEKCANKMAQSFATTLFLNDDLKKEELATLSGRKVEFTSSSILIFTFPEKDKRFTVVFWVSTSKNRYVEHVTSTRPLNEDEQEFFINFIKWQVIHVLLGDN